MRLRAYSTVKTGRRALRLLLIVINCLVILRLVLVRRQSSYGRSLNTREYAVESAGSDINRFVSDICRYLGSTTLCSSPSSRTTHVGSLVSVQYVETRFNGFGSQFLRMLDAASLADALQTPFEVVPRRYWNYGCAPYRGWACYFNQTRALERNCVELGDWRPSESVELCIRVSTPSSLQRAAMVHARMSHGRVHSARRVARTLWRLNMHTSEDVNTLLASAGVNVLNGRYVGMHVRRGDKRLEVADVQLMSYARAIRCLVRDDDTMPVFVASDDGAVVAELRMLLAPREVLAVPGVEIRTGHYQIDVNRRYMRRNRAAVTALLAEVVALRQATWFIATFSSNFARMVHVLRDAPPQTSISLDDRWAPGVAWRTFGKPYCSSPDANHEFCTCNLNGS